MKYISLDFGYDEYDYGYDSFFKTSKYIIQLKFDWTNNINTKYFVQVSPNMRYAINRVIIYDKKYNILADIDADIAFSVLPHPEDIVLFYRYVSNKIIDKKIEKLLNLKLFI